MERFHTNMFWYFNISENWMILSWDSRGVICTNTIVMSLSMLKSIFLLLCCFELIIHPLDFTYYSVLCSHHAGGTWTSGGPLHKNCSSWRKTLFNFWARGPPLFPTTFRGTRGAHWAPNSQCFCPPPPRIFESNSLRHCLTRPILR